VSSFCRWRWQAWLSTECNADKKLWEENDVDSEAIFQRLDRLTMSENLATAAETLELVYGLVRHRKDIMDGEHFTHPVQVPPSLPAECSHHQVPTGMNPQIVFRVL